MTNPTTAHRFFITNQFSGAVLGIYEGIDAEDAARAMRRDAGYQTDEAAALVLGIDVDELNDELVIELVDYAYEIRDRGCDLPDGWGLCVWPDGRAMVCSPGTCPSELSGYDETAEDTDTAMAAVADLIDSL